MKKIYIASAIIALVFATSVNAVELNTTEQPKPTRQQILNQRAEQAVLRAKENEAREAALSAARAERIAKAAAANAERIAKAKAAAETRAKEKAAREAARLAAQVAISACISKATLAREDALISAFEKRETALITNLKERRAGLEKAFAITVAKDRNTAIQALGKTYETNRQAIWRTFNASHVEIIKTHRTAIQACRKPITDTATKTEVNTTLSTINTSIKATE